MTKNGSRGLLGIALIIMSALGAFWLVSVLFSEDSPTLTTETLETHRAIWNSQKPSDYELRLLTQKDKSEDEIAEVTVRDGQVVAMQLNGGKVERPTSNFGIDGLFETMEREIEMATDPSPGAGARAGAELHAKFHPTLGIPLRFVVWTNTGRSFRIDILELKTGETILHP